MKTLQTDMGQLSKNRINVLIAGKFLEILNEREEQELEEWLSANPENRNFYDRIMQAHDNNDRISGKPENR